ncbi:MAG: malonyl-CoA decarboxylase [Paracoccaceae bacterium]
MERSGFLSDILSRVAVRPVQALRGSPTPLPDLCANLVGELGEAAALSTALEILDRYDVLDGDGRMAFFQSLAQDLGHDDAVLQAAIADWTPGDEEAARRLHFAAEPRSQELIRRLNQVPGATARLVGMRADLLRCMRDATALAPLDMDFRHLFSSWFNRGFLEIRHIDWSTPAEVLEKIIAYEAVHEISGWDDLRRRVAEPDRRLFGFFHPAMPSEPLIFVEVALTRDIPGAITDILSADREAMDPGQAKTAVFYSISNCQKGLRGISFGSFLIKQVVSELQLELPNLRTFVTLSPIPGLRRWAEGEDSGLDAAEREALTSSEGPWGEQARKLAARFLTTARRAGGTVADPVAHFHLGNGAQLYGLHAGADPSERGMANSWGVMANYLYDEARIEARHQAYAAGGTIDVSSTVRGLAR